MIIIFAFAATLIIGLSLNMVYGQDIKATKDGDCPIGYYVTNYTECIPNPLYNEVNQTEEMFKQDREKIQELIDNPNILLDRD